MQFYESVCLLAAVQSYFFFNSTVSKTKFSAKAPLLLLLLLNTEMQIFLSPTFKKGNVILHINHQQMSLFFLYSGVCRFFMRC